MSEKVLVVSRNNLPEQWLAGEISLTVSIDDLNDLCANYQWLERAEAEANEKYKQIIPYILIFNKVSKTFVTYQRHGNENRLHGLFSIGVGGHINPIDAEDANSVVEIIWKSLFRELNEELQCVEKEKKIDFIGIINEEKTKTGRTHLGLVFLLSTNEFPDGGDELLNMQWANGDELKDKFKMELWSKMALHLIEK